MPSLVRLTALVDPLRLAETRPIVAHAGGGVNAKPRAPDRAGGPAEAGGDAANRARAGGGANAKPRAPRPRWRPRRGWRRRGKSRSRWRRANAKPRAPDRAGGSAEAGG